MFTSLTGCALIVPDNSKALEKEAIKVGSTVLSKQEVVDLWYSFYNENSSVFYYYGEEQIVEIFYKNIVLKHAVMQETQSLIAAEKLQYSAGDDANVWLDVLEYFATNVDKIEKALYTQQGVEDKNLPKRLQTESSSSSSGNSEVKSYLYSEYDFTGMQDYECKYLPSADKIAIGATKIGKEVTDNQIKDIQTLLATFLGKTPVDQPDDEEVEYASLNDLKNKINSTTYYSNISNTTNRNKAFDMFVGKLMLNAKADGRIVDRQTALLDEIKRVYISSYETYLQNMYSNYINSLVDNADSNYYTLSDKAIVSRYLQLLGSDIQKYNLEENYVAVLEAKSDNALLLYRYNGEYYYFTVQHLLVGFDESITEKLGTMYGNSANASLEQYNVYKTIRDNYYNQISDGNGGVLSNWEAYNNATYRDENGYEVYTYSYVDDSTHKTALVYFDKDFVAPETPEGEEVDEKDVQNGYYYSKDGSTEKVYLTKEQFDTCKKATKTVGDVLTEFNTAYTTTISILNESASASKTSEQLKEYLTTQGVQYVISEDLISAYMAAKAAGDTTAMAHKVYTNIFMQHAFKYSTDSASLGTNLSNYVGMVISGRPDNHNVGGSTYVNEFTDKARQLAKFFVGNLNADDEDYDEYLAYLDQNKDGETLSTFNYGISDYGIHMIVVNDVYKVSESAPITGNNILAEQIFGSASNQFTDVQVNANVSAAIEKMKAIYVSSSSSQTLYEYMYEKLRDELVGSNGSVYTKERNRLYNEYVNPTEGEAKAKLTGTMTYDELMEEIS